eukprot:symbB.v1.2.008007.t1/scaffold471.1/size199268/13
MEASSKDVFVDRHPEVIALRDLDVKLNRLHDKVDICITEISQLRTQPGGVAIPTGRKSLASTGATSIQSSAQPKAHGTLARAFSNVSAVSSFQKGPGIMPGRHSVRSEEVGSVSKAVLRKAPRDSLEHLERTSSNVSDLGPPPARRRSFPIRNVDLKMAWQNYAKEQLQQELSEVADDGVRPLMRIMHRNRCDDLWELLDDPSSSRCAWWVSQFLATFVIASMLLSLLEAAEEEPLVNANTAAVLELCLDSFFLVEFLCRILSAPSKSSYIADWLNWPDLGTACGIIFRGFAGFVVQPSMSQGSREMGIILFLILPIVRFLKLLRYFESFRLLIDATRSSAEALPVLCYIMALITLTSATGMYLVEDRSNIPTIYHAMWLAIVTMTTVGYGDYFPTSLGGYIIASMLTFTSVLFLALPVGIIGHEFTRSWQTRGQVLLKTRIRRCMMKWGYNAKDLRLLIEYVDVDCDGVLALTEFLELMRQMRIGISAQSAIDLFMAFDDDSNGYIDYDEFLRQIFPEEYVKDTVDTQILHAYGAPQPQPWLEQADQASNGPQLERIPSDGSDRNIHGFSTPPLSSDLGDGLEHENF